MWICKIAAIDGNVDLPNSRSRFICGFTEQQTWMDMRIFQTGSLEGYVHMSNSRSGWSLGFPNSSSGWICG